LRWAQADNGFSHLIILYWMHLRDSVSFIFSSLLLARKEKLGDLACSVSLYVSAFGETHSVRSVVDEE